MNNITSRQRIYRRPALKLHKGWVQCATAITLLALQHSFISPNIPFYTIFYRPSHLLIHESSPYSNLKNLSSCTVQLLCYFLCTWHEVLFFVELRHFVWCTKNRLYCAHFVIFFTQYFDSIFFIFLHQ